MIAYKNNAKICQHLILIILCYLGIFSIISPVFAQENTQKEMQNDKQLSANEEAVLQRTNDKLTSPGLPPSNPSEKIKPANFSITNKISQSKRTLGFTDFLTSFFFLISIIVLIMFLAWLFKRTGLTPGSGNKIIKVVSAVAIGQKEKIALIEVGNQQILIGLTPGNIQKLLVLESPVQVDDKEPNNGLTFASQLFNYTKNKNAN